MFWDGDAEGSRAVEKAVAALIEDGSFLMRRTSPRFRVLGTERRSSATPFREGRFWRRRRRFGVKKRRKRNVGRCLLAKTSGWGVPWMKRGSVVLSLSVAECL